MVEEVLQFGVNKKTIFMKITDIVESIDSLDDDLIIFQEDLDDFNSNVILANAEEGDGGIKKENGKSYYYLLEIFLAKEFIEDWVQSLDYDPGLDAIAKRLYDYAINDA
jgi:hypothetical protein